jgi:O-antigen ligase
LFGYGPFGFVELMAPYVYPHNLFLELLLAGGVVGLAAAVVVAVRLAQRYFALKRRDAAYGGLGVLMTYQLVMLMFSGTYLAAPTLWFAVGVIVGAPKVGSRSPEGGLLPPNARGNNLE